MLCKAGKAGHHRGGEVRIVWSDRSGSVKAGTGEMEKRELHLSMNNRLTELLALLCFSLLSY